MRVVTRGRLHEFAESHATSRPALDGWYATVCGRDCDWARWEDVKAIFPSADRVGDCVVFNIGGNNFRLIARIRYRSHKIYILKVMTHAEYSRNAWRAECGCDDEPPVKPQKSPPKRGTSNPEKE